MDVSDADRAKMLTSFGAAVIECSAKGAANWPDFYEMRPVMVYSIGYDAWVLRVCRAHYYQEMLEQNCFAPSDCKLHGQLKSGELTYLPKHFNSARCCMPQAFGVTDLEAINQTFGVTAASRR